jgi:hypothetical protein
MKDFYEILKEAFPPLKNHSVLLARIFVGLIIVGLIYGFKKSWKPFCKSKHSELCERISSTSRWLRVYQESNDMDEWKYYTSETTGMGRTGDDIIWTLVDWPSLKPKDSFRVHGAVGMIAGVYESQAKLLSRWDIVHDPDGPFVGGVPARGIRSLLRRAAAKVLWALASI